MNLVEQAWLFATQKHVLDNHQLYGNLKPYTHHLEKVHDVLVRFGFNDDVILASAVLHDVVEDTRGRHNEVKGRDIQEIFGEDVGVLGEAVTSEEGANRKIRNALTYPKIRAAGPRAVALKLADRIANIENGGKSIDMYKKEHADFKHGIYIPYGMDGDVPTLHKVTKMQDYLDVLLGMTQ